MPIKLSIIVVMAQGIKYAQGQCTFHLLEWMSWWKQIWSFLQLIGLPPEVNMLSSYKVQWAWD